MSTRGQETKRLVGEINQFRGSEMFILLHQLLESRLGDVLFQLINTVGEEEILKQMGRGQELTKLLEFINPRVIEGTD